MTHLDLFSGIGGFALATERVWGSNINHIFCDNDQYCQQVLKKHWPKAKIYGDIRTLANTEISNAGRDLRTISEQNGLKDGSQEQEQGKAGQSGSSNQNPVFILTGGFPCQPFSQAGRRKGTEDDRYLWPEMLRVIRGFRPRWVVGENVAGLITWDGGVVLEQVCLDLEAEGYEVQPFVIPAVAVNAPHRRDRVWIVAHASSERRQQESGGALGDESADEGRSQKKGNESSGYGENATYSQSERLEKYELRERPATTKNHSNVKNSFGQRSGRGLEGGRQVLGSGSAKAEDARSSWKRNWIEVATELCRMDDGLPAELDGFKLSRAGHRVARLKALGNAIVPQVAEEIMRAIHEIEKAAE